MERPGFPDEVLQALLNNYFPMIRGTEDLEQVVPLLTQRGGEFCGCLRVDTELVARACRAGFLPMGESFTGRSILLIKSHTDRCVHDLQPFHVGKSSLRRARGTTLRFSTAFAECLERTVRAHAERWLTDRLCGALVELSKRPRHGVRAVSAELYRGDAMVAGEIGYACGTVYTSLSGFYRESGAGKVQLLALGVALRDSGFTVWDLGMPMEYKFDLGANTLERTAFLALFRDQAAGHECSGRLDAGDAHELLRRERSAQTET